MNRKEIFDGIYKNKGWGYGSGPGSDPRFTTPYRAYLLGYMRMYGVKTVLDIGCGDWRSSRLIDWSGIRYTGTDVSEEALKMAFNEATKDRPGRDSHISFVQCDAVSDPLPDGDFDLVIIKDVLQHLSNDGVQTVLARLDDPRFKRVIIVNDIDGDNVNSDIEDGGYRPLDVTLPPFCVPAANLIHLGKGKTLQRWIPKP